MKLKKLLVVATFAISAPCAQAGIMAELNEMFMSNSTASGTMTTRDRTAVFGGSVSMRMPIKNINLVAFDPPRMNAGCGGIDLYGGSFSFINGAELIAVFRNVASNAAGLAFKAAIKAISPSLDSLISEFQATLQMMNNLGKNSCSLAHLIVEQGEKAIGNVLEKDGAVGSVAAGMFTDATAALKKFNENAPAFLKKTGEVTPEAGNQVWKAVLSSGTGATLGMVGIANADGSPDDATDPNSLNNRVLVSVLGFEVSGVNCSTMNEAGTPDTTMVVSANELGRISCRSAATLTLDDFVKGGGPGSSRPDNPLQLYKCMNPNGAALTNGGFDPQKCTDVKTDALNYPGIRGWINTMLFGSPDDTTVAANSIMGIIGAGNTGKFTPAQVQFMKHSGMNLTGLMQFTSNQDYRLKMARLLRVPIENCVAAQLGVALYKSANRVGNNNSYHIGDDSRLRIDQMRTDAANKQKECDEDHTVQGIITTLNAATNLVGTSPR